MESKALLDSGFHVLFMLLLVELVVWIPIVNGIFGFNKIFFPGFRIPRAKTRKAEIQIPFHGGRYILQQQHLTETSLREMINNSVLDKDEP